MFRIIRWLCFPIATRIGQPPIRVYFILISLLVAIRTMLRGGPDYLFVLPDYAAQYVDPAIAPWILPAVYVFAFLVFPAYTLAFDRRWWAKAG